ncbi:MAG TPA: ATP-binding protein [Woeseiaceae bacterium]|nr:ATP-binding protein [Woeseiaceae bacterium]
MLPNLALDRLAPGSLTIRLAATAAFIWLSIVVAVVFLLLREREATLERESRNLSALALALEAHTARTFQAVDLTLAGAVDAMRLADNLPPHDPEFQEALERRLEFLTPYVRAIFIIDATGRVIHDTRYPDGPALTPAGDSYFLAHRRNPALVSRIGPPVADHPGLGWFVPVTRRVQQGAEFGGVAVAAVQPLYFETLFRRMGLGRKDVISLYHVNGDLISRFPDAGRSAGRSFADSALFAIWLPQGSSGTFVTDAPAGQRELVAWREVEGQPLVVSVAENLSTVLAPWRAIVAGATVGLASLLAVLTLLVLRFSRQQRIRERAYEQAASAERMQALGHLTSGIAHDFNNLLGIVSTSLGVLSHEEADTAARRHSLAAAERAVRRGAELIRRLATFARSRPMELKTASLNDCIESSRDLLERAAGRQVEVDLELAPSLPPCRLDDTELEVALVNLVLNARDAMAGAGRILIRTYPGEGERVCVSVEDTGHGMSEAVQRHAFEPYYTTKGEGGSGLGLAQVYGFMLQVGGEARVESNPGAGTKVELCFPSVSAPAVSAHSTNR